MCLACGCPALSLAERSPCPRLGTSRTHGGGWMENIISSPEGSFQGCAVFWQGKGVPSLSWGLAHFLRVWLLQCWAL